MLFTEKAPRNPNYCFVCQNATGPFVDFEKDFAVAGTGNHRMYLCPTCVIEAGNLVGCASPDDLAEMKDELSKLNATNVSLEEDLAIEKDRKLVSLSELQTLRAPTAVSTWAPDAA